jgi:hypothetical protein
VKAKNRFKKKNVMAQEEEKAKSNSFLVLALSFAFPSSHTSATFF